MRVSMKQTALLSMIVALGFTSACGNINRAQNNAKDLGPKRQIGTHGLTKEQNLNNAGIGNRVQNLTVQNATDAVITLKTIGSAAYVPVRDLTQVLQFQTNWSSPRQTLQIGDNDANYEIQMNTNRAVKDGEVIQVDQPFVLQDNDAFIPVTALSDLFQEDMSYEIREGELHVHPSSKAVVIEQENETDTAKRPELDFADDPADPFKGETERTASLNANKKSNGSNQEEERFVWLSEVQSEGDDNSITTLKNVDINGVIRKAEQYLGVKYAFGTGPFPQTGYFDCSTFTQYVFGKSGVKLPRLARQQANVGTPISRKSLRKGDLMFFYVPGRFKSNQTVGHVGIYMGNMKMINALPKPKDGVQITNIDKAYWKETFLCARRVAY